MERCPWQGFHLSFEPGKSVGVCRSNFASISLWGTTGRSFLASFVLATVRAILHTGGVGDTPLHQETPSNDQDLQDRVNQGENQQPVLHLDTHDGHPGNRDRRGSFDCIRYLFRR